MKPNLPCLAVAGLFAALAAGPAAAQTPPAATLSVTGEASISAPPDLAVIDAGVTTEAKTARDANSANNDAMGKVLLSLRGAGIDQKDIQTSQLSLQTENASNRLSNGAPQIVGYRATNRVTIRLHDVAKLAAIIDVVTAAGANDIGGINFAVSQASRLLDDARAQAVADARRKADIYAKAAGVMLGSPLSIAEENAPGPIAFRRMAAGLASPTPIAQGEETLHVTVAITWEIKPAQ